MTDTIITGHSGFRPLTHVNESGIVRHESNDAHPVVVMNSESFSTASGSYLTDLLEQIEANTDGLELTAENVNLNTDELEAKLDGVSGVLAQIDTNTDGLETQLDTIYDSGVMVRDADGTTASVAGVSGGFNAVFVQVDNAKIVTTVLASGTLASGAYSSGIDVSNQGGYYNNALFVGASASGDVNIYANSDGDSVEFALVDTLNFTVANQYLYYDLKGYEDTVKIQPLASGAYFVKLIRTR